MNDSKTWLELTQARAIKLSQTYRRRRRQLVGANVLFVAVPAALSTAAAVFAATSGEPPFRVWSLPPASIFAGSAAVHFPCRGPPPSFSPRPRRSPPPHPATPPFAFGLSRPPLYSRAVLRS